MKIKFRIPMLFIDGFGGRDEADFCSPKPLSNDFSQDIKASIRIGEITLNAAREIEEIVFKLTENI